MHIRINLRPAIPKITLPNNIYELDITYPLIEPYAYARIYFDKNRFTLKYDIIEVKLSEKEKEVYKFILEGVKNILIVKLSEIGDVNKVISYLQRLYDIVIKEYKIKMDNVSYQKIFYYLFRDIYGLSLIHI